MANHVFYKLFFNLKVRLTHEVQERWRTGDLKEIGRCSPPDEPNREETLSVVAPGKIKRGKGGTLVIKTTINYYFHSWAVFKFSEQKKENKTRAKCCFYQVLWKHVQKCCGWNTKIKFIIVFVFFNPVGFEKHTILTACENVMLAFFAKSTKNCLYFCQEFRHPFSSLLILMDKKETSCNNFGVG